MAAGCYSCRAITLRKDDPVGACLECGAFACQDDGERDLLNQDFICGMCDSTRLSISSGLPNPPEEPPEGPPGGGVPPAAPPSVPDGGGAGGAIVVYASSEDFEGRRPTIAGNSAGHRMIFRDKIGEILEELSDLRDDSTAHELASDRRAAGLAEFDPRGIRRAARELGAQIYASRASGDLDPQLLADALGVAAWASGADTGAQPTIGQLRHLSNPSLRLIVGLYAPVTA